MIMQKCKKLLAMVLVVLIAFSCVPFQVFANEAVEDTTTENAERNLKWDFIVEVNTVLVRYLGKVDPTNEEIEAAVLAMGYETYTAAQADIEGIKSMLYSLSEEEQKAVLNTDSVEKLGYMESTMIALVTPALLAGESASLLNGNVTVAADSNGTLSESSGTVTVTTTGSILSKKSTTITITNSSSESAAISFNYSASTYNSFTVNGASASATGTCSVQLDAGSSVSVVLQSNSGLSNRTATVVLSNFSYAAAQATSVITFDYDSSLGSVSVDGNAVADGGVTEISKDGATLTATPATGTTFLGWTDGDGLILSTDASFTYKPFESGIVKAVFTNGVACFGVGSVFLSDNLTLATDYAQSSGINVVFLANNGTLPAGNYNIPAGVTLLIPFDSANTMYTTEPDYVTYTESGYTKPTAYRTLTMASGANLVVDGSMNLSAKHIGMGGAARGLGNAPTGAVSFVKMQENSNITVNNGGSLYAYGYIIGSGNVVANSGATVYEYFQVGDFPGGSNTTELTGDGKRVFLFSQYYIQNIEVPLKIFSGADVVAVATVDTGVMDTTSTLTFISSSSAMFNLSSGYAIKRYDGAKDRLFIDLYGEVTMSPIEMEMGTTLGSTTINSEEYELPITNSITLNAKSGSSFTINQNLAMLPGAEINIDEGATGVLGTGISVYVYDVDSWGKYIFAGNSNNVRFLAPPYAPGRTYTRTEADLKDAAVCINGTFDATAGYIYTTSNATGNTTSLTTEGGANIYSTDNGRIYITPWGNTTTYQFEECVEGTISNTINYVSITAEQAKLTNADGSFTSTTTINDTGVDCKLFVYENGKWVHHEYKKTGETAATCAATGSVTYTCTSCSSTHTEETAKLDTHNYDENGVCTVCGATIPVLIKKDDTSDAIIDNEALYVYGLEPGKVIENVFEVNNGGALEVVAVNGYKNSTGCLIDVKTADGTVIKTYTVVIFGDVNGDGAVDGFDALEIDLEINRLISLSGAYALAADVNADGAIDATDYNMVCSAAALQTVIKNPMTTSAVAITCEAGASTVAVASFMSTETVADEACVHEYEETVVAPTCTTKGYTIFTCSLCDDSYEGNEIDATGHTGAKEDEVPATCLATGMTEGLYCSTCNEVMVAQKETPALGHNMISYEGRPATYSTVGWEPYEECSRCGKTTYVEIPMLETPLIEDYETFIMYLSLLEQLAYMYSLEVPETDPAELVIKYIRTGVDRYNSGSWGIMAGYEDKNFANYVASIESDINLAEPDNPELWIAICSLKNLGIITVPNGDEMDFGHMFGVMDISYHNKTSLNHADVAGWAGDIVDLISDTADGWVDGLGQSVEVTGTVEEMVEIISKYYLATPDADYEDGSFDLADMTSDLDGYYFMQSVDFVNYTFYEDMGCGDLALAIMEYYTETLNDAQRAKFYLENRLGTTGTREQIRNAVYTAYTGNKMIATLEDTREFKVSDISDLRIACCYAFADYVCKLAGDYVDNTGNEYFSVFNAEYSNLAPGITQTIKQATTADGKRMVYYLATADITREDVNVYANYGDNDPSKGWQMQTVEDQMRAAQANNADVENFNVIAGVNGSGFNMGTGQPVGLLIMDGVVYSDINSSGFFGIDYDGNAVIGTMEEYNTTYKGKLKEAISGFSSFLIRDGKIVASDASSSRASRTAVGITATGKVVFMVLDGRQEPVSCGGSMVEIAQIMYEAGCVQAVNLDGGGSSTYVAKQEGADDFGVVNKPSDGFARSVSTSFYIASTAPSSTAFDHAIIESDYDYMTVNSTVKFTAKGVSATGNEAELPADAYWTVADSSCGTITADGVLTGLKSDTAIEVQLMSGDELLATKTVQTVTPTSLYYSRNNVNVTYGDEYELPIVARYGNKKVAINENDIKFELSNKNAGTINGFTFIGDEASGVKNVVITAELSSDSSITAEITLILNKVGEATFDFENATGGNRLLAWSRDVSNSTTEDNVNYQIVNTSEDMVTTYAFAIDMTQLEIPDKLQDIVYMLPGAEEEDASAWKFLLQLAERVSDMTTVNTTVTFDKDFDVDYSEVKLVSDYFELTEKSFDEETNTLTVKINWIKQSQAIDETMANPLCIVSGIKVTPKDTADWGENNKLDAVANGQVDYKIYLRANALYTFSTKVENQEIYGLYPFVNPNLETERGGYFEDVHAVFEDKYTLINSTLSGWINVDGGYAYYENGESVTGVHKIDGYYYDFGENGVNVAKTKYSGLLYDKEAEVYRYAQSGEAVSGWQQIGEDWYHFDSSTLAATVGEAEFYDGVVYTFEETGKLSAGVWAPTLYGMRYYYGPSYCRNGWYNIDGKDYCFENTVRLENGYKLVKESNARKVYYFNEDGSCDKNYVIPDGFYTDETGLFYSKNGAPLTDLHCIDGKYYCFDFIGYAQKNGTYSGRLFKDDYAAYTGLHEKDGTLYYYENGRTGTCGLIELDGDYYYVYWGGVVKTDGRYYVETTYCDLPVGNYTFGPDGKMLNGIVELDGTLYYYENGRTGNYGLVEFQGDYYYVYWGGAVKTDGKYYVDTSHCDLPAGNYEFGADGKMLNGVVEKDGTLYYYTNGRTATCGLFKDGDDYYYSYWGGVLKTDGKYYVDTTYCDLPVGNYTFGADGKMLDGIVELDGTLYYYVNGKTSTCGLFKVDGDYYYAYWGGVVRTDGRYYVDTTYCDLPVGNYSFGADGKMLDGIVDVDGTLYYYINGKTSTYGLFKVDGDYYYAYWGGVVRTDGRYYVDTSYCDLPAGNYTFGADGKMLNGIVEKDGTLYYYKNGTTGTCGLTEIDGDYYYVYWGGVVKTGGKYYVDTTYCDLPVGNYEFGEDGKMLDGFITRDGEIYYYENGKPGKVGLNYIDGYYYFITANGLVKRNGTYYAWETNGLSVGLNYTFDEYGRAVI